MVVIVKYKILPGKNDVAIAALTSLIEIVLEEPYFISIKMNVDLNDPENILLYEEWKDGNYYNGEHKNTPHLIEFMRTSREFLSGAPEITQWETIKTFTA
ncbi:hypothetical protein FK178_02365 [Antarcticibacterium arcticum]|uniref:ABM domain-containing protein n=1 Tax=Antarcticibacterium arcticum TaxID=2585771 RepID=A0A5B8YHW9_9FLAO|nr:antibiotic biosynthesis monooxygenase [Antarcticibacterium arcticum]QED36628.1 hypothetical protein FK178_02365 [Antarcticibacterium arcticum]